MALGACNFLLSLPLGTPNLDTREEDRDAEGNVDSRDIEVRRAGQRHLAEAGLANRYFHNVSATILWGDPFFRSFPDVLSFALALQLSAVRGGLIAGDAVKRLALPAIPAWSVGGPQLLSNLVTGIAAACGRGLRTLRLDSTGDAISNDGLAAVFATCRHLTALRISVRLGADEAEGSHSEDDDDDDDDRAPSPAAPTNAEETNASEHMNLEPNVYDVLVSGIARLNIFDLAGLCSSTRKATASFLAIIRAGIAAPLRVLCLGAFEDAVGSHTQGYDLAALLTTAAARCSHLEVLQVLLPDERPAGMEALTDALKALPGSCSRLHTVAIRHRPRPYGTATQPYSAGDYPVSYVSALRPALRQLVIGLPNLARLDLQGVEADEKVVHGLAVRAPATLHTLLMDTDACPPPQLLHLIVRRGAQLRRLSLISVVHHPTHQLLAAIAAKCVELVDLRLWLKAPDSTESLRQLEFMFPDKWIAALKETLRRCPKLTRVGLSWVPSTEYTDAVIELDSEYPGLIDWGTFPATARCLPTTGYPEW
ncbi:hypothetical protein HDU87_004172 [Geranomyces variabilis]|uniref:Uncharacterized protein n=1 Tax=Geranomyces variabilis TaxID=109894 RepID=A0AAD5TIZ2_9FUNG|nr:hypothetical protein HDU87_004172 [Geranomyces variabilis]